MGLELNLINLYFQWGDKVKKIIKKSIPTFQLNGQKCPAGLSVEVTDTGTRLVFFSPFFKKYHLLILLLFILFIINVIIL